MSSKECILLLGSNINDKNYYLNSALHRIERDLGEIIQRTKRMETKPVGFSSDELILNQKVKILTNLSPFSLLKKVKQIEVDLGRRERTPKNNELYSDREIDIDILNYANLTFLSKRLIIPHPQVVEREFVKALKF